MVRILNAACAADGSMCAEQSSDGAPKPCFTPWQEALCTAGAVDYHFVKMRYSHAVYVMPRLQKRQWARARSAITLYPQGRDDLTDPVSRCLASQRRMQMTFRLMLSGGCFDGNAREDASVRHDRVSLIHAPDPRLHGFFHDCVEGQF
jgi:hypothetical protein